MLKVLLSLALVGLALTNNEQGQIAESKKASGILDMSGEQRNKQEHKETILIVKPSKTTPHHEIQCGPNEVVNHCATPCQPSCEFPHQLPCPELNARSNAIKLHSVVIIKPVPTKPHLHCTPGCVCAHGFVRSEFGECVPKSLCPPLCKPHSHFENCGPRCQPTCEMAEPRSLSVCAETRGVCVSGCFCDAGYVKDLKTGLCVTPNDCTQICPQNEHYSKHGVPCAPTCQNPVVDMYKCNNYSQVLPGCYCNQGFLRDWDTKQCVRDYDCPTKKCPSNEEFYECKPCTPTCHEPHRICTFICISGCDCQKGYVRDSISGKCVQLCECPQFQVHHKH